MTKHFPKLNSEGLKIAPHGVILKSIYPERMASERKFAGQMIKFSVEIASSFAPDEVFVRSNLSGDWKNTPAISHEDSLEKKVYYFELVGAASGRFLMELRLKKADQIYLDPAGLFKISIDPKNASEVRLYTLIPQATGAIQDWIHKLPSIASMGFNAVHLLPVTQMDISHSPYSAHDLFALDQDLVSPEHEVWNDWKLWIDALKKYKMGLCIDLVLNHVGVASELVSKKPEWFQKDRHQTDGVKRAGAADGDHWTVWSDLVLLDYAHPDPKVQKEIFDYMGAYAVFWAGFAAETGGMIRLDNLHSGNEQFMEWVLGELRKRFPDLVIFSELFTSEVETARLSWKYGLHLCLSTPWTAPYAYQLRGLIHFLHDKSHVRHVFPLASHDSGAPAQEYGGVAATLARYALVALCSTGQTGIVQGNEHGYPEKIPFIGRPGKIKFEKRQDLEDGFAKINELHREHSAFRQAGNLRFVDGDHGALVAAYRWSHVANDAHFLIVVNLDPQSFHSVMLQRHELVGNSENSSPALHTKAVDVLTGKAVDLSSGSALLEVPPGGYFVYQLK
jgi:hypothetical protein